MVPPMSLEPAVVTAIRDLDREVFNVVAAGADAPSEEDLAAFEQRVGFRLPEDFREFTKSPAGGLYLEVREDLWPSPELYEVGPFWSFLRGLKVFGIAKDIPEWLDLRAQHAEFAAEGRGELVPFLALEGSADRYVFDREGNLFQWRHDLPEPEPVEGGFVALLLREVAALVERKDRKLAEGRKAATPKATAKPRRSSRKRVIKKGKKPPRTPPARAQKRKKR